MDVLTAYSPSRRGMALISVLASLVFLVALALAFLASIGTELKSSKTYAEGGRAQLLAQSAVNLAVAQITAGAKGVDGSGSPLAWASQPGMIRTYDAQGRPYGYYKLYSWDAMVGAGAFNAAAASEQVPSNWNQQKAIFVDLNQPSAGRSTPVYPIVDGNNLTANGSGQVYGAGGSPTVEGFSIAATAPVAAANGANPVPMPVKWLYMLADGNIVLPSPGATGSEANIPGASAANPIVGRIAFWADDETCKINVNTASDGFSAQSGTAYAQTYWDSPKFTTLQDYNLAENQPAQHEYQRYPGHPAMVALSTVFPKPAGFASDQAWAEEIYKIVPRIVGGAGSSQGGTSSNASATVLSSDRDRLYASVDELIFKSTVGPDGDRDLNDPVNSASPQVFNQDALERARFFLTASSRAPDLNLFNKPRVSIWPVSSINDAAHRTSYDQLLAFCSTMRNDLPAPYRYHFLRADPTSQTMDLPPPAQASVAGLGRNRMLLEYLRDLTSQSIPGFGGNFAAKYSAGNGANGTDRDQILTQIFDYIRSTNIADSTVATRYQVADPNNFNAGRGEVVPIIDQKTNTRGFGRYPTVQGAFLLFAGTNDNTINAAMPPGMTQVQALFFVNLFTPSVGYPTYNPKAKIRVEGLQNFRWRSWSTPTSSAMVSMGFPANGLVVPTSWSVFSVHGFGGTIDFIKYASNQVDWFNPPEGYRLRSAKVSMPAQSASSPATTFFEFTGGPVKVEVLAPDGATVVQTVHLDFPSSSAFPVPRLAPVARGINFRILTSAYADSYGKSRLYAHQQRLSWIAPGDVVRSVVPATGDVRLMAARASITTADADYPSFYAPHAKYGSAQEMLAHHLRNESHMPYYGATAGRILNLNYWRSPTSLSTYTLNNPVSGQMQTGTRDSSVVPNLGTNILGDWDNGTGEVPDGPFINKADEGTSGTAGGFTPYFGYDGGGITDTLFSPNRMMPSAGMFGSLPTGVWANRPWQTLLFCPNPLQGSSHRGFGTPASGPPYAMPPDHLLLDLFYMPVVEPYAISEPLSTAGRINMNYQIVPFTYIRRDTAIRAILKPEKVVVVPDAASTRYKSTEGAPSAESLRLDIDAAETLKGFQARFDQGDLFRSASEICSLYLVPKGATYDGMPAYWNDKRLIGDNSRERPYTTIYPRLTTKSNTFTIHFRAQALQKASTGDPSLWNENVDRITGEFRGSQTVERYVDPNNTSIPDYASPNAAAPISDFYKFRVVQAKQFSM